MYINCSKGFHQGISHTYALYFNQIALSITLLSVSSHPLLSSSFSYQCFLMPSAYVDAMYSSTSHLFLLLPSPPSSHSSKQFHYYNHVIYIQIPTCGSMWLCMYAYIYLLALTSIYEVKYVTFVLLNLAYFAYHDNLQFYPFNCKQHNFILIYDSIMYINNICICMAVS
jgi:hypothetical protein